MTTDPTDEESIVEVKKPAAHCEEAGTRQLVDLVPSGFY